VAEGAVSKVAIVLDFGGTQLRAAVIDRDGQILHREAVATKNQAGPAVVVGQMADISTRMIALCDVREIAGVGLCSPGPLDIGQGLIVHAPTIRDFTNVPVVRMLEEHLGRKVLLEGDAIAAACGEWKFGAGRGVDNIVYMTVSTGLGGGVISDGRVLYGARGLAGHIGHMKIFADGERCGCGNPGCWEAYASATNFTKRARVALGEDISAKEVFAGAKTGDVRAQELVDQQADYLGIGMVSCLHLFNPERIIIGGGMSNALDQLMPGIMKRINADAMPAFRDVEILRAGLGDNSGLLGTAQLVFSRIA
jgi:glucokinase